MHQFIISRLQCAATYPSSKSLVNETAAATTTVPRVRGAATADKRSSNVIGPNTGSRIQGFTHSYTGSRLLPKFPGRFCSCQSVTVVHLKGTSEKRV
ncbi:hypothetical protein T265_00298 [Opisthorchis viverrini]|uniref:Uncharacterized protein n=1 Tax=Opisthorchis viverrini TaxID=6198 RepID=A0A075AJR6_OPIVI|nr:hypothetical protein T265_00298 [Opisthorchis viverrini]KER33849.1 hypothetical protein T265_00298 [Opisthorchis viverrini]